MWWYYDQFILNKTLVVATAVVKDVMSYFFGSLQFLLLSLKDFVIILVLLKLFLAAVEQQFAEVHKNSRLVRGRDFQLEEENIE